MTPRREIILTRMPLPPLKPMDQLRFGVKQMLEVQTHPMALAIPIFIQIHMPLLLLKLMDQSKHGVTRILEAQTHMHLNKSQYNLYQWVCLCAHPLSYSTNSLSHPMS
jgi:hypothetical protein